MDATLTSKGQLTLPAELRKRLNLQPGDRLDCVLQDDGSILMCPRKRPQQNLKGIIPKPAQPLTLEQIEDCIRQGPLP